MSMLKFKLLMEAGNINFMTHLYPTRAFLTEELLLSAEVQAMFVSPVRILRFETFFQMGTAEFSTLVGSGISLAVASVASVAF